MRQAVFLSLKFQRIIKKTDLVALGDLEALGDLAGDFEGDLGERGGLETGLASGGMTFNLEDTVWLVNRASLSAWAVVARGCCSRALT